MQLRIMSDIHTDSSKYRVPDRPNNKQQTLVLQSGPDKHNIINCQSVATKQMEVIFVDKT